MIDGREKCKCQLAFELQSSHMFLKSPVNTCASEDRKKNQYLKSLLYLTFTTDLSFISHSLLKALASHLTPTQHAYFKASKYYIIQ